MFSIIIGRSAPQTSLKNALGGDCLRSAINNIFTLQSTYSKIWQSSIQKANNNCNIGDYSDHEERFECLQLGCDLDQNCDCAWYQCCTECNPMHSRPKNVRRRSYTRALRFALSRALGMHWTILWCFQCFPEYTICEGR